MMRRTHIYSSIDQHRFHFYVDVRATVFDAYYVELEGMRVFANGNGRPVTCSVSDEALHRLRSLRLIEARMPPVLPRSIYVPWGHITATDAALIGADGTWALAHIESQMYDEAPWNDLVCRVDHTFHERRWNALLRMWSMLGEGYSPILELHPHANIAHY
jgi:hypothetical protein